MTPRRPRIATYGYFGMGNIGNEGSLAAFLEYLRRDHPEAVVSCIAAGPEAVRREHGIPATRLMAFRADPGSGGLGVTLRKVLGRVRDVPRTFAMMTGVDVLVVPGTGVLETRLMAGPWGLPLWMFLATLSCRVLGRPVLLVSVGAEPAEHPMTRRLFRGTVRLATYVSYRDAESQAVARSWGVRPVGPVHPDLAFSLPAPAAPAVRPGHVVVGVMAYQGRPGSPEHGPGVVREYAGRMAELVGRLGQSGRSVTLVVGDVADLGLARDIRAAAVAGWTLDAHRVVVSEATTMTAIMAEMAQAEVVVASRFHNVIAALRVARPVVSLGYAGKNDRLLEEFGLGAFVQPMDELDVDLLLAQLAEVQSQPGLELVMKEVLRRYEDDLAGQFRHLSTQVLAPAATSRRWRRALRRPARLRR